MPLESGLRLPDVRGARTNVGLVSRYRAVGLRMSRCGKRVVHVGKMSTKRSEVKDSARTKAFMHVENSLWGHGLVTVRRSSMTVEKLRWRAPAGWTTRRCAAVALLSCAR